MISLEVQVDAAPAREFLDAVRNQVPFAQAMAINRTAEDAIAAMKDGLDERFVIRRPWVREQFFINKRADKAESAPTAVLAVGKDAGFLLKFEQGGLRQSGPDKFGVTRPFAIPTKLIRPDFHELVDPKLFPVNLGVFYRTGVRDHFTPLGGPNDPYGILAGRHKKSRRKQVAEHYFTMKPGGQESGPFVVDKVGAGVWVRLGSGRGLRRGRDRIRLMWKFKSSITVPASLQFGLTTNTVIAERFEANFDGMMAFAIRTAR